MREVRVPDIGDFDAVPVIEVLVAAGDTVAAEDPLIVLESDKASMEVPSPAAGVVGEVSVAVGDEVSEGDLILTLEGEEGDGEAEDEAEAPPARPTGDEGETDGAAAEPSRAGQEEQQAAPDEEPTAPSGDDDEASDERPPAGTFDGDDVYAGPGPVASRASSGSTSGRSRAAAPRGA